MLLLCTTVDSASFWQYNAESTLELKVSIYQGKSDSRPVPLSGTGRKVRTSTPGHESARRKGSG